MLESKILEVYPASNTEEDESEQEEMEQRSEQCYVINNTTYLIKKSDVVRLANFEARIIAEEIFANGMEQERFFIVEGTLSCGYPLPEIKTSAEQFYAMKWPLQYWGSRAIIFAGTSKDHLRAAIQLLSGHVPQMTVYAHSGWQKIAGRWLFLHNAGGIRAEGLMPGVGVAVDGRLGNFELPDPPLGAELVNCVRASLKLLDLAPAKITVPLISAIYRAPLGEMATNDFSLFFAGHTGGKKTELTALAQAHFGPTFHSRSLPGNWISTGNALEKQAFQMKDAVFAVDDFLPLGTSADIKNLHLKADRLFRGQGNVAGRSRLRPDGGKGAEYYPRGIVISSGEELPRGQSLRARLFVTEVSQGDVDLQKLTEAQEIAASGLLAQAMAGFVQWLAPQVDRLKATLPVRQKELRDLARTGNVQHDRTPSIQASLALGLEMFLEFAQAVGAIREEEKDIIWHDGWDALAVAAKAQNPLQAAEDPADRFVELLSDALSAGRAHLVDAKTGGVPKDAVNWGWRSTHDGKSAEGECIGWVNEDVMLEPTNAFRMVKCLANERGESLTITQNTLWKRLREKGFLASSAPEKNVVFLTVQGVRRYVLHVFAAKFLSHISGSIGSPGTDPRIESIGAPESSAQQRRVALIQARETGTGNPVLQCSAPDEPGEPENMGV